MSITSPEGFYRAAGKCIMPLMVLGLLLFVVGFYMGFFECPIDYKQGNSYRIIFIHVSAAWMSMLLYILMAVCSAIGLLRNSRLAFILSQAMAPTGALLCFIALFSGAFWGRPTWGTYWVWDARLTSALILFFLYLGFMALHTAIDDNHQGASITTKGSSMAEIMLYTLLVMVAAGMCYGTAAVLSRARTIILERERRSDWALEAAKGGKL